MFTFVTHTWNPVGGECQIKCDYCYAREIIKHYQMAKYVGAARLFDHELNKKFKATDFVFVSDMRDLFEPFVPSNIIQQVLDYIAKSPAKFLLLTKYPRRYLEFKIPENCVCGATIETDLDKRDDRFISMRQLNHKRKMVSVEPIMKFSPTFASQLIGLGLEFIAVGYDNHKHGLNEPSLAEANILIAELKATNITVYQKTIREKCAIPITVSGKPIIANQRTSEEKKP